MHSPEGSGLVDDSVRPAHDESIARTMHSPEGSGLVDDSVHPARDGTPARITPHSPENSGVVDDPVRPAHDESPARTMHSPEGSRAVARDGILALPMQFFKSAPVQKLPPEVLCEIFYMSSSTEVHKVCSDWRDIALRQQNLWIDIPLHDPERARCMIKRAGHALLDARYWPPYVDRDDIYVFLSRLAKVLHMLQTTRIRMLKLDRDMPRLELSIPALIHSSAVVETIHVGYSSYKSSRVGAHSAFELPDTVLVARFPNLQHLIIDDCDSRLWGSSMIRRSSNLNILAIHRTQGDGIPDSWIDIIETLGSLLLLEYLSLSGGLPPRPTVTPPNHGITQLPALTTLLLDTTSLRSSFFLDQIGYPPTCSLDIKCSDLSETDDIPALLIRVLGGVYGCGVDVGPDSIAIYASADAAATTSPRNFVLRFDTGDIPAQEVIVTSIGAVFGHVGGVFSFNPSQSIIYHMTMENLYKPSGAKVVHVDWSTRRNCYRKLAGQKLSEFVATLQPNTTFPQLTTLIMDQLDLVTSHAQDNLLGRGPSVRVAAMDSLVKTLETRLTQGVFLLMRLVECQVRDEDVERWMSYIPVERVGLGDQLIEAEGWARAMHPDQDVEE